MTIGDGRRGTMLLRMVGMLVAALAATAWDARVAYAQMPRGTQWGARVDAIGSEAPSAQAGLSVNVPAGLYVRLEGTLAAGAAWRDGGATTLAARGDVAARFLLDPFAESRYALYALGGVSVMYDGLEQWRPRLLAGIGIERKPLRGRPVALELALGGGVRLGLVVRQARSRGR